MVSGNQFLNQLLQWSKGKIVPIEPIDFGRPYELFAALAGVGQSNLRQTMHALVKPITEPRGIPSDMNTFYQNNLNYDLEDCCNFAHSWLIVQEIIDFEWNHQFVTQKAYVKNQYDSLFGNDKDFPDCFPQSESLYYFLPNWKQEPDTKLVSWKTSYKDYVRCSEWLIEELLKLGDPKKVRVVFLFDA